MPDADERLAYETAVGMEEPAQFKNEIQKIADDYAIEMPANWIMEVCFDVPMPEQAIKAGNMPAALYLSSNVKVASGSSSTAILKVLAGQAEQPLYTVTPQTGKIYIGRDKNVQTGEGFFRENTIAFPSDTGNESNRFISRQHAHIEWDDAAQCYLLYADEGGVPPRNKIKVKTADGGVVKLQATEIGHRLQPGDQILLGDGATLEFNYEGEAQRS
jgi:hypothetical protein